MGYDLENQGQSTDGAVLLLHCGGMSSRQWRKLAERLVAMGHVVLAPDFLGSGGNPPWPRDVPFHFDMDVALVERLIDGPFHLVGHSYGGLIALQVARRHAERVRSLTLYDPVAFGVLHAARDEAGLADLERVQRDPLFTDDARGGTEPWWRLFIDYWNGPGAWDHLPEPTRESFLRVGRKVYLEVRSLMNDRSGAECYASIPAPTLLLTGEKSPPAAHRVQAILSQTLPSARLQVVDGAGHMGPISDAQLVNELIAAHLKQEFPIENVQKMETTP